MIAVQNLSFRFRGSRQEALKDVTLSVDAGEFLVITGPSGCGKSTLALAIGGYLFRQYDGEASGQVVVAGMDVGQCPIYDVAEVVGLVQQNPEEQFCTLTVRDEIAFGLENRCLPASEIGERVDWALGVVGASHLASAERSLSTLSGGEKQKVAIAAMMATKPQVLIFDEPTSSLDPTATSDIFAVIAGIRTGAGITVIVIEHKIDYLLPFAPRLIAMDKGQIVYDGPPVEAHRFHHWPEGQPVGRQGPGAEPAIRVQNLYAGYNGHEVLKGVSTTLARGEFVVVMGDNGSGKTTLLWCLLGLLKPSRGQVEVLGRDTRRVPVSQMAQDVGFLFQNPDHQLFADSVWEEAAFAPTNLRMLEAATEERIRVLLARCGLADRLDDHPYRLSYGQKRRLNLISVLGYQPPVILLDELLIGQDPENAAFLLGLLRERVELGDLVIMVNHEPEVTWRYASRVLFFADGRLVVDAPPPEASGQMATMGLHAYLPASIQAGVPGSAAAGRGL